MLSARPSSEGDSIRSRARCGTSSLAPLAISLSSSGASCSSTSGRAGSATASSPSGTSCGSAREARYSISTCGSSAFFLATTRRLGLNRGGIRARRARKARGAISSNQ